MLKQKLDGEQLKKVKVGDRFCCWGGPDDGCDCSGDTSQFSTKFNGWLSNMDGAASQPGPPLPT